jgi:hypothetical protein
VIKLNSTLGSDSLLYEYFVGMRVNHYGSFFPNFLETYGSYNVPENIWEKFMNNTITIPELKSNFELNTTTEISQLAENCNYNYYKIFAIMIQHMSLKKDESTLYDCMKFPNFVKNELIYTLFQVYSTLSALANVYTHYDLHTENVLMYVPNDDQYIEYHYHYPGGKVVTFKSKYIVKIIDYGRNYIHVDGISEDSTTFYNKLCKVKECNISVRRGTSKCGKSFGFSFLNPVDNTHYITCSKRNVSHDLRLASSIIKHYSSEIQTERPYLHRMLSLVVFNHRYGTPELINSGLPRSINNVTDMETELLKIVEKNTNQAKNDQVYAGKTKIGDLHVYPDMSQPMEFISA